MDRDECMKKYRVSRFTKDILIIDMVFFLGILAFFLLIILGGYVEVDLYAIILISVPPLGIICIIYSMCTGVSAYKIFHIVHRNNHV